ncbi:MAG TPA: hypothetical protein RMG45_17405, partial [Polyangiaceae bacterium LLY-WYZ-15_(1-7)]|nr:hypothetical protein [Polyangiaceae bacterium LLY-WYZ-15_(1-7)]
SADRSAPMGGGAEDAGADVDAALPGEDGGSPARPDAGDGLDDVIVWAHSPRELFAFDPRTNGVTEIGRFRGPDGSDAEDMTDLAVDGFGNLFTCSFTTLYRVDAATAEVTEIGALGVPTEVRFNALTFVPAGALDPAAEVLVAATADGDYYRIDVASGAATRVGTFADGYGSSGDLVSVLGAGTFATVFRDDLDEDWLVRLDPATGEITPVGSTGTVRLFGLGYWRNRLYGFNSFGWLLEIDVATGEASVVEMDTGADVFFGAGVTTNAPTAPI